MFLYQKTELYLGSTIIRFGTKNSCFEHNKFQGIYKTPFTVTQYCTLGFSKKL